AELQRILDLQKKQGQEDHATRNLLAVVLVGRGQSKEALQLLGVEDPDSAEPDASQSPEDQRTIAVVLAAQRYRPKREAAIRFLKHVNVQEPLSPEDQFLLAQLYDMVGQPDEAQNVMSGMLAANPNEPRYLVHQ